MDLIGNLLIAPPAVKGNFWTKTVIVVTEHHVNGSVGLILNRRSQMTVNEFAQQLGFHMDVPGFLYLGGPINVKNLSFLHSPDWRCSNTMQINQHLCLSSAEEILPRLALGDRPKQWRMFLGLCGWSPNQLLNEIKGIPPFDESVSWCVANGDLGLIFGSDTKDQWMQVLERSGQEFAQNILT
jgi:putative transcriptional regulator